MLINCPQSLVSVDTFSDNNLVSDGSDGRRVPDYESEIVPHPFHASVLLVPFLLNYFACWYTFCREARYKKYTFIFPLLNLYPQFGETHFKGKIVGFFLSIFQRLRE